MEDEMVLCPYCGSKMGRNAPVGSQFAWYFCPECASCSPAVQGATWKDAREKARSAAMKRYRPMQKPLTVDELREMSLFDWVWIEILEPSVFERITYMKHQSAYYKKYRGIDETEFNCGYPGMGYAYYYCDYGKTWIAFQCEPTDEERDAARRECEIDGL